MTGKLSYAFTKITHMTHDHNKFPDLHWQFSEKQSDKAKSAIGALQNFPFLTLNSQNKDLPIKLVPMPHIYTVSKKQQ